MPLRRHFSVSKKRGRLSLTTLTVLSEVLTRHVSLHLILELKSRLGSVAKNPIMVFDDPMFSNGFNVSVASL